ncbi:MAG: hypothetical protein Q7W05_14300, partial [Deltaproteobacteria bacterium]|nr:hypothetical protein [Deltaproteobacteria bacterium]
RVPTYRLPDELRSIDLPAGPLRAPPIRPIELTAAASPLAWLRHAADNPPHSAHPADVGLLK